MARPRTSSNRDPPKHVEYSTREPAGLNLVTKPSKSQNLWNAPEVTGKNSPPVNPPTKAFPSESTAMLNPSSSNSLMINVE